MLEWFNIKEKPIPYGTCVLAIHRTKGYTSDVYMVWKNPSDNSIPRWPHKEIFTPITHWAYYNVPDID